MFSCIFFKNFNLCVTIKKGRVFMTKRKIIIITALILVVLAIALAFLMFIPKGKYSDLTYVAIGDSITFGYDSENNGKQMSKPYPQLVKEKMGFKEVYNYGICGSTLSSVDISRTPMSIRYREINEQADIISVLGGINDFASNKTPLGNISDTTTTTIYGALNTLAKGLKEKFPNAYIFFMTPFKWGDENYTNQQGYKLKDLCNAIKEVCSNNNIDVLDLYTYGEIEVDYARENSDKLHPGQDFFKKYTAPQICEFIKENYQITSAQKA